MMKKNSIHIWLACSIATVLGLIWIVLYTSGAINFRRPTIVSDLKTGYQANGTIYLSNSGPNLNSYSVCGDLNDSEPRNISIILQNLEGTKSFGANEVSELITPGYFCSEIKVTKLLANENYKFVLYDRRYIIGEVEFEITK